MSLQAALTTFEDLQKWQGPEGERLGEPDDPKCSLPFCNALESAVVAVEQCKAAYLLDARSYMRAVREAVRVVEEGVTVGRYVVEERQQLYRLKVQDEERRQEAERLRRLQQVSVVVVLCIDAWDLFKD
jgi:hypothetical protein